MDIQAEIDKLLAKNPQVQQYVDWVKYVPAGNSKPESMTHLLSLASTNGSSLNLAIKAKPEYAILADAILANHNLLLVLARFL